MPAPVTWRKGRNWRSLAQVGPAHRPARAATPERKRRGQPRHPLQRRAPTPPGRVDRCHDGGTVGSFPHPRLCTIAQSDWCVRAPSGARSAVTRPGHRESDSAAWSVDLCHAGPSVRLGRCPSLRLRSGQLMRLHARRRPVGGDEAGPYHQCHRRKIGEREKRQGRMIARTHATLTEQSVHARTRAFPATAEAGAPDSSASRKSRPSGQGP